MSDVLPPGRLLSDEQILESISDGYAYFEVYLLTDRDNDLTAVSSEAELDRVISLAGSLRAPSHVWLTVPRAPNIYTDAVAMPTSEADLLRIKELYVPMWSSEALPP